MSVGQLGRIAFGFAGDGLDAQLVYLSVGAGREDYPVSQLGEESMPERVVFVHIQHSGNAHCASWRLVGLQRFVGEQALQLIIEQIGYIVGIFVPADASLTAVAGDVLTAS